MKSLVSILGALMVAASCFGTFGAFGAERVKPIASQPVLTKQPAKVLPKRSLAKTPAYTDRIASTPDVNQHMTWAQFLNQIPASLRTKYTPPVEINVNSRVFFQNFCGPASVANQLMWLDANHFSNISDYEDPLVGGVFLARRLGDRDYMKTMSEPEGFELSIGTGTKLENLVGGTVKFLKEKGIPVQQVHVVSLWTPSAAKPGFNWPGVPVKLEHRSPRLDEVKLALKGRTIVVQIFGHYEFQVGEAKANGKGVHDDYFNRTGGHFFSPVGFGETDKHVASGNTFIYHDPASDSQGARKQHFHAWLRPSGVYRNLWLRNRRDDGSVKYAALECKDRKGWECLDRIRDTYIRDKQIEQHAPTEKFEVMEGLVVIRV